MSSIAPSVRAHPRAARPRQETPLNSMIAVGGVAFAQAAISYAVISAGTGNGSFVGLGAMLAALYGIPITAIANLLLVRNCKRQPKPSIITTLLLISSVLPALQIALLVAQQVFSL